MASQLTLAEETGFMRATSESNLQAWLHILLCSMHIHKTDKVVSYMHDACPSKFKTKYRNMLNMKLSLWVCKIIDCGTTFDFLTRKTHRIIVRKDDFVMLEGRNDKEFVATQMVEDIIGGIQKDLIICKLAS